MTANCPLCGRACHVTRTIVNVGRVTLYRSHRNPHTHDRCNVRSHTESFGATIRAILAG